LSYHLKIAESENLAEIEKVELAAAQLFSDEDLPAELKTNIIDPDELEKARLEKRLWLVIEDRSNKIVGLFIQLMVNKDWVQNSSTR
jgi:hypothetical protein